MSHTLSLGDMFVHYYERCSLFWVNHALSDATKCVLICSRRVPNKFTICFCLSDFCGKKKIQYQSWLMSYLPFKNVNIFMWPVFRTTFWNQGCKIDIYGWNVWACCSVSSEWSFKCCQYGRNVSKSLQKELHLFSVTPPFPYKCLAEPCRLSFQPLSAFGV